MLISCSDDDDNGTSQESVNDKLIGFWTLETYIKKMENLMN
mgnify:CR=1 FL=1